MTIEYHHKIMTIKEAILKSLEDLVVPTGAVEITDHILKNAYYKFGGKTPNSIVSSACGSFIKTGDVRVKRIKRNGTYFYYLAKNQDIIDVDSFGETQNEPVKKHGKIGNQKTYAEKDLHKLLSSYLKVSGTYTKTIPHEQSNNKDHNQIWTHPDMVGIRFQDLQNTSKNLLKAINPADTFKLSSYELKRELNNDSELKKAFFQAVSNSSWANYGYLVAFEISDSLTDEMERLNLSFGIGIIKLNANPFRSKILHQAECRKLDFKTIDKLCKLNKWFEEFIGQTEKMITANEPYYKAIKKELDEFCDDYFADNDDTEVEKYCKDKNILPTNEE